MKTQARRSDADVLAEMSADLDGPIWPPIDGAPIPAITAKVERMSDLGSGSAQDVADARAAGCSWTLIGEALGVSRQAARQRYGHR